MTFCSNEFVIEGSVQLTKETRHVQRHVAWSFLLTVSPRLHFIDKERGWV